MTASKRHVGHYVKSNVSPEPEKLPEIGRALWVWNFRSHGDHQDILGYRDGYFRFQDGQLYFWPQGGELTPLEDNFAPVLEYIEIVD